MLMMFRLFYINVELTVFPSEEVKILLQSRTKWNLCDNDETAVTEMVTALQVSPLLAKLLIARGMKTKVQAELFLNMDETHFHDPYLLDGMQSSVERLKKALNRKEKIRIYGDYDADGVSSTSLMICLLRELNADFDYYIPHRIREGYGLNRNALEHAKQSGISLIVTVDTGISAVEEVDYAVELGIDIIITDHHEPPEVLPQAYAILNPKKPGCNYPFKQLAGVGVAFKLAHALLNRVPVELLEFAAIGTVADLMPLMDENRLLVKLGIEQMRRTNKLGIHALLHVAKVDRVGITASHIGFSLSPRINASGRLESADTAVTLLTTTNEEEAELLAKELELLNKERQHIVEEMMKDALELIKEDDQFSLHKVTLLAKENWNVGVIGIVASKVLDKYYRPTLILSIDPETGLAKGSARSIPGFDIYKALSESRELLVHFGGHQAAAGLTLRREHLPELTHRLQILANQWLTVDDFILVLKADIICTLAEVPIEAIQQLDRLAPFGMGNPSPRFMFTKLNIQEMKTMGKEQQHLKLLVHQEMEREAKSIEAISFGRGSLSGQISPTAQIDLIGELSINEWNGLKRPQIVIQDLRILELQLFDWRGTHALEKRWLEWLDKQAATEKACVGILLFSEKEIGLTSIANRMIPLWRMHSNGEVEPLNASANKQQFEKISDLMLLSMPSHLAMLQAALRQATALQRIYAVFQEDALSESLTIPNRDVFKTVYGAIQQHENIDLNRLTAAFSKKSGLSQAMILFILEVFEELAFIERIGNGYRSLASPNKKDLASSLLYQQRLLRQEVDQVLLYSSAQQLNEWIQQQHQVAPQLEMAQLAGT